MTAPEAALAAALHKIGLGCLRPIEASRDVCVPGTRPGSIHDGAPEALTAALHDAGYALTPLAPEVPPQRVDCSKCGSTDIYTQHQPGVGSGTDRMEHRCRNCRYSWWAEPLDRALAATRTPEPPDSGDGAAPDCEAVKSTLARLVLHPAPTIASRSFRVALAEGLRLLGYEAADPDEYTPEPRDAGIDAALLARAWDEHRSIWHGPDSITGCFPARCAADVVSYLRSGSPAPEGGE